MLLSSTRLWFESTGFQTRRLKATRPDGLIAASVLQRIAVFNYFVWRILVRKFLMCGLGATLLFKDTLYTRFSPGMWLAHLINRSMDQLI